MSEPDVRAISEADLEHETFPQVSQSFRVYVCEEAFDRVAARGKAHPDREVGGVLVGQVLKDEGGAYVRVDSTIDALHAEEKGTELTFTHATWEHIHSTMDAEHASRRIVGWYHTHPGFGVFLSDRDEFIQRSFFDLPYQIALVYDPARREHGVFSWRDGKPARCRRYWIGRRECVWEGAEALPPAEIEEKGAERGEREPGPRARGGLDSYLPGIAMALLLVLGLLLGWWWRGARIDGRAQEALRALELLGQPGSAEGRELARVLAQQRMALAAVYLELASEAKARGDLARTRRLLRTAASLDPRNAAAYLDMARKLEEPAEPPAEGDPP